MEFSGKNVLITGAAVGIGRACAIKFAEEGADLALLDLDAGKLEALKKELSPYPVKIFTAACDVSKEEEVNRVFKEAQEALGTVDILVNNAALWRNKALFLDTENAVWDQYMSINVLGVVYCIKAVLGGMMEKKYGRIINVASVAGVYGNAKMVAYSATKGAVIAMTRALAQEVADQGITVNAVSPGTVSPSSEADIHFTRPNEMNYMGRTGSDAENADLICFIASEKTGYISGQNIQIDGCRRLI